MSKKEKMVRLWDKGVSLVSRMDEKGWPKLVIKIAITVLRLIVVALKIGDYLNS